MRANRLYSLALTIYLAAALVGWAVLVPGWMSGATLGAIVAVGFGLGAVSLMTLNAGRSTRSVAHVIYETETEPRDPVKAAAPLCPRPSRKASWRPTSSQAPDIS